MDVNTARFCKPLAIGLVFILGANNLQPAMADRPVYRNPDQPLQRRVDDLLSRMSLEEKIGQLNMGLHLNKNKGEYKDFVRGTFKKVPDLGPGCGVWGTPHTLVVTRSPRKQAAVMNEYQRIAAEETRLGIPLLQIQEGTHGFLSPCATIFPEGPAIGSTWDMDLVRRIYAVVAREARAVGVHQICTLVIEPNRDPRLGRNEEGYSEDPYLCSRIAFAVVRGAQGDDISAEDKVIATLCHYPGQSESVSGIEQNPMEISDRMLREVFLPPWVEGIKRAGALGVMATYPSIDSIPAHSSRKLLTNILRKELKFEGVVVSEGDAFNRALIWHRIVDNQKEAGLMGIKAGVDISIWFEPAYMKPLIENVQQGRLAVSVIDESIRRILTNKFRLGLFEKCYVDVEQAVEITYCQKHQQLSLEAARKGIVLLKNNNSLLPLDKDIKSIAVIGPNADSAKNQLGDYCHLGSQQVVTVLRGIREKISPETELICTKGCEVVDVPIDWWPPRHDYPEPTEPLHERMQKIEKAKQAAEKAEVAIVVLGENTLTNGEARDVASLDLTGLQSELVRAIVGTGTPTVVVLINGRPLSIRWIADNVPAVVEAWLPGEKGGRAVADVLFGDYNPGGKLPVSIPRHVGQLPVYYNYKPPRRSYVDMPSEPLYEFGYGLSYTQFEYGNLKISPKPPAGLIGPASQVLVSADIENTGDFTGDEVVQLYINDRISSVTTPLKELKGFERITLQPGEKRTVEFTLTPYELSLLDRNMERVVEPGVFEVMVGSSSKDIRLKGEFEVEEL